MTERAEHTAGPWFVTRKRVVGPRSDADDQSFGMVIGVCDVYGDNADADSRLIAAAPDLLAALKAIQWFCDDPNGSEKGETLANGLVRLLPAARDAISRATGEA